MRRFYSFLLISSLTLVVVIGGCTPTETTTQTAAKTPEEAPKLTLKEALEKTSKLAAQLNQGFEDGADHHVVHDPLHEISNLLAALPNQIEMSDLSDENKLGLATAVETLMDNYGKIDAKFHGQEGAEYADVKDKITEALTSFDSIWKSLE